MSISQILDERDLSSAQSLIAVLNAIAQPIVLVEPRGRIAYVNPAAEQFFQSSLRNLKGQALTRLLSEDSSIVALVDSVRARDCSVSEYRLNVEVRRVGPRLINVHASPIGELPGHVVLTIDAYSIASKIDSQLTHRNAARSVTAMAAMLAHEVKNPLSGIRGAAQLVEQNAAPEERPLLHLICEEADRIVALVDRMEMFADERPIAREAVNIHEVLEHVRRLIESGPGRDVAFEESYDPSLPPVLGNRDLLVQIFLNLVKNAVEAVPDGQGAIRLATRYQQGVRLAVGGGGERIDLPLVVTVRDNGPGIPEDLRTHLFDPFVTTKRGGKGLGLALVAKVVGDHGGIIEFDSRPGRTTFKVLLPQAATMKRPSPDQSP